MMSAVRFTLAFVAKNSNPPQARAIPRRRASALSRPVGVGERSFQIPSGVAHGLNAQEKGDESFCRRRGRYCVSVGTARCAWHDRHDVRLRLSNGLVRNDCDQSGTTPMRQGWEIEGRSSGGRSVAVHQPYLLDVDKVTDRLTHFQSTYREKVSLIDGQRWRYRRTGSSARPLVMLPGVQGGGAVFFDVALVLCGKLDLITVTAPPVVDAAALADAQA